MLLENAPVELIPLSTISVKRDSRQRKTLDKDVDQLATQLASTGQINPILVKGKDNELVAGERRLMAAGKLGWTHIKATRVEKLPERQAFLIELLENVARKDLPWQDQARAMIRYHAMRVGETPEWTTIGTANDIGISQQACNIWLRVAAKLDDPEIAGCQTLTGAFNLMRGRADRAAAAAHNRMASIGAVLPSVLAPLQGSTKEEITDEISALISGHDLEALAQQPDPTDILDIGDAAAAMLAEASGSADQAAAESPIITADFIEWVQSYSGPQHDVIHMDLPYGKNYAGSNTRRTGRALVAPKYADSPDVFWALLAAFLEHQDKIAYPVAHCMFWFDMSFYQGIVDSFTQAGWTLVQPFPLIWAKPYQGVAADPRRRPRHCYETALLFSRGDRKIVRLEQDFYEARTDEKLHISQKPEKMLRHFLKLLVDEHTAVFDPTCGSGTALKASMDLGAQRVLGLELDTDNAEVARFVLARPSIESADDE